MMMSAPELTPTVLSLALALLALARTTDSAITCEAVTTRYDSTVTCFFGTDIFDSKHSFNLQFYYPNLHADPETHLMCNWVTEENIDCVESPGVVYNHVLADQMTVKGPADPHRVGGKYVCQVLPSLGVPVKPCNLTFRDVTTTTTTTTTQPSALEDLTDKVTTTLIVCVLVLTIALILIIIVVLFIVSTRVKLAERIRKWRKWTKKKSDGEKPEEMATVREKIRLSEEEMNEVKVHSGKEEAGLPLLKETPEPSSDEAGPPVVPWTVDIQLAGKEGNKMNEVEVHSGKEEAGLLHMKETPRPSSGEAGPPVYLRTVNIRLAGKEGDKKHKWWKFWKTSSSSAPKAQPGDQKLTETGEPLEVTTGDEDTSSGKGKKGKDKTKKAKGKGEKESPGTEATQQPASTVDGREEARRLQSNQSRRSK